MSVSSNSFYMTAFKDYSKYAKKEGRRITITEKMLSVVISRQNACNVLVFCKIVYEYNFY